MSIPYIIAGPCSAEGRSQLFEVASCLKAEGVGVLRAGLWKPRTRPGSFEGVGEQGLQSLVDAGRSYDLKVCTEVASPAHVRLCLEAGVDMVWIGARTAADPFAVQEIADAIGGAAVTVLVKNPPAQDTDLWIGAIERLLAGGVKDIVAVLRGVPVFGCGKYRNDPAWNMALGLQSRFPKMKILCDPSHMAGKGEYVAELSQKALDIGLDGLMVEVHPHPQEALTDSRQQLSPQQFHSLLMSLSLRSEGAGGEDFARKLEALRLEIDEVDDSLIRLLGRRMEISRSIGRLKKENGVTIVQGARRDEVLRAMLSRAGRCGLDGDFTRKFFSLVHEASVQIQQSDDL